MTDKTESLYEKAKMLLGLASRIEKASSEEEENRLCDERDGLLADFRKADSRRSPLPGGLGLYVPSGRDERSDEHSIVAELLDVLEEVSPFVFDDTLESVQTDGGPFRGRTDLGRMCVAVIAKAKAHLNEAEEQVRSSSASEATPDSPHPQKEAL